MLGDNGTALISYSYSDFGETTRTGDENTYNEIAYIGGIYDESTQLYYLNARYYDPTGARFLTRDPARDAAMKGLYAYCAADPIDGTDPSGEITSWGRRPATYGTTQSSNSSAHSTVRRGSRGASVKNLQQRLNALGYGWLSVDGAFGPRTYNAVRAFQRKHKGLAVDGIVGPKTWAALTAPSGKQYTYHPVYLPQNIKMSKKTSASFYFYTANLLSQNKDTYVPGAVGAIGWDYEVSGRVDITIDWRRENHTFKYYLSGKIVMYENVAYATLLHIYRNTTEITSSKTKKVSGYESWPYIIANFSVSGTITKGAWTQYFRFMVVTGGDAALPTACTMHNPLTGAGW